MATMLSASHLGLPFLCVALIFLIVVSVSAPTSSNIGFMKVEVQQVQLDDQGNINSTSVGTVVFGIFGLCLTGIEAYYNQCWKTPGVGYDIGVLYSTEYLPSSPHKLR